MYKILSIYFFVICLLFSNYLRAQTAVPCENRNITTNPAAPVNTENPAKRNRFDWTTERYLIHWDNNYDQSNTIHSPYDDLNENTLHLYNNPDMAKDGWELIGRDLGFDDQGNPRSTLGHPYVVLYNKYTGTIRVFGIIAKKNNGYNYVKISLKFVEGSIGSAIFTHASPVANPIDQLNTSLNFEAVSRFIDDPRGRWFMADFPVAYDPCTCLYESRLQVDVQLVHEADIVLKGAINGELLSVKNGNGNYKNDNSNLSFLNKTATAVKGGISTYNTIDGFYRKQIEAINKQAEKNKDKKISEEKIPPLNLFQELLRKKEFLKAGLRELPWIGSALSIANFFIAGGKKASGPQAVKLEPMTVNLHTTLSGKLIGLNLFKNIIFNNPGSGYPAVGSRELYPYYNEVLGVLNLLQSPVLKTKTTVQIIEKKYQRKRVQYRLPEPLMYVLNPAARLNIQDMQVALLITGDSNYIEEPAGTLWEYEGFDPNLNRHVYRSPYISLECLNQNIFYTESSNMPGHLNWQPKGPSFIKVMANLRRQDSDNNTQNVLFVATYPVKEEKTTNLGQIGACAPVPPQKNVSSFCNSEKYKRLIMYKQEQTPDNLPRKKPEATPAVNVFPNPGTDVFTFSYTLAQAGEVSLLIHDQLGRTVKEICRAQTQHAGSFEQQADLLALPPGIYFYTLQTPFYQNSGKLVIIR